MKKFIDFIINKLKQKKINPKLSYSNYKGKLLSSFSGKNSKKIITSDDSLSFNSKEAVIVAGVNQEAMSVLKEAVNNPEVLVNFIKSKGTKVIKFRYMKLILFLIGEQEGFLPPLNGAKALVLSLFANIFSPAKLNIGFNTPALFAFDNKPVNIYIFSHQFHMWLSYINELPGFEENTRKNLKTVWDSNADAMELREMSIDDLLSLKDAIARDTEAIKFVKEMSREFVGQKLSLQKIRQGKRVNI